MPSTRRARPRALQLWLAAVVTGASALVACAPPPQPTPAEWVRHDLTRDGSDITELHPRGPAAMEVRGAPGNAGGNSRTVFTRSDEPVTTDQEVCLRYRNSGGIVQEGLALRIDERAGAVRAVTVTKNIWGGGTWIFNVHTWDTTTPVPMELHASFDMSGVLGGPQGTATWSTCARIAGSTVTLKVWPADRDEPAWGGPESRSVRLPPGHVGRGRAGWYIGHVERGHWARLDRMEVRRQ